MADGRSCSETESNVEDVQESLPQTDEDFLFEAVRNGMCTYFFSCEICSEKSFYSICFKFWQMA